MNPLPSAAGMLALHSHTSVLFQFTFIVCILSHETTRLFFITTTLKVEDDLITLNGRIVYCLMLIFLY